MVGDEFQHGGGRLCHSAGNRHVEAASATDCGHQPKNFLQRNAFPAKKVAMTCLPALHRKHQPGRDIAYIDEVHDEIEIKLKTPAEEVSEHRCRRSEVMIVRSNRHCRSANHDRKSRSCSLQCKLFGEHLRTSIRTRHIAGRQQAAFNRIVRW